MSPWDDLPGLLGQQSNALMLARALIGEPALSTADVRNALSNRVVERGFLAPLATYGDGTTRVALPGLLSEPIDAWNSLLREPYRAGAQDDGNRRAISNALMAATAATTGGLLATRPSGSIGMGGRYKILGYRGLKRSREDTAPPGTHVADDAGVWFGSEPEIANSYAMESVQNNTAARQAMEADRRARFEEASRNGFKNWDRDLEYLAAREMDEKAGRTVHGQDGANVSRSILSFDNPLVIDYGGKFWSGIKGQNTTSMAADAWKAGHDALIVKNVVDYGDLAWLPPYGRGTPGTSIAVRNGSQVRPWYESADGDWFKP